MENKESASELRRKSIQMEEEAQRNLLKHKNLRLTLLAGIITITIILTVLLIVHAKRVRLGNNALKREKKTIVEALHKAQEAGRAQDEFIRSISDEIRDPLAALVKAAGENAAPDCGADRRADNMMKVQLNTDRIIKVVDDIMARVDSSAGEKVMMLLLMFSSLVFSASAQNNPYGLRNDLYEYYLKCDRNVQKPEVLAQTDTLIMLAHKEKNQLLECMAYDIRVGHAYFSRDINKIHAAQEEMIKFVKTTPYTDYIFYARNRSIIISLNNHDFVRASRETREYQSEALRLNNAYGITKGYYYMGEIYRQRGMDKEAIEQYAKSIEAAADGDEKRSGISFSYSRIGEIYLKNGEYDKAERNLKLSIKTVVHEYELVSPNLSLFRLYVMKGDVASATKIKTLLEKMDSEKLIYDSRRSSYVTTLVRYYMLLGDDRMTEYYLGQMDDSDFETRSGVYAALGNYKMAFTTLHNGAVSTRQSEQTLNLAQLAALQDDYEYSVGEVQKNKLELENTLLQVEQLKRDNELNREQNMQDSAVLSNNRLLKLSQITKDSLMSANRAIYEESLRREKLSLQNRRNIALISGALVLILLFFVIAEDLRRRMINNRLLREKKQAAEACRLAEEAVMKKKLFLEQIAHEIRTPLNAVLGFNQVLCDEKISATLTDDEVADMCCKSNHGVEALEDMIDTALELCELEAGRVEVRRVPTDINFLCDRLAEHFQPKLKPGVTLTSEGQEISPILIDGEKLERAMSMLVDNACKFTGKGTVKIVRRMEDEMIVLSVVDTGCGIPEEKAEEIFQSFAKVDSFVPGIGLGLTLCRSLVRLIGGEVTLDTNYTNGARFVVKLVG
jgi:signal transduction histidine kinase/tetratricopeptide (TPR) repeat protein